MASSIDDFDKKRYCICKSSEYFGLDLNNEIKWSNKHLDRHDRSEDRRKIHLGKNLKQKGRIRDGMEEINRKVDKRKRFHEQIMDEELHNDLIDTIRKSSLEHKKRLELINGMLPKRKYKKLSKITMKFGGEPKYFVFDKNTKKYFFVNDVADEATNKWMRKTRKMVDVIMLDANCKYRPSGG